MKISIRSPENRTPFIPIPLPPKFSWNSALVSALSEADRALGNLAGEGSQLPNAHLLMSTFLKREAVLSCRIDGTQTTLSELLAAEAGRTVDRDPEDLRRVSNYVNALEHGITRLKHLPLSLRLICELHKNILTGVGDESVTPGEFRHSQNWISGTDLTPDSARCAPPPTSELTPCLGAFEKFFQDRSLPPLVQIALLHYQFEAIHPFLDGNGRVGRLLIPLFLVERAVLPTPLLCLSAFFLATKRDYCDLLAGVSQRGEWEPWLVYFLKGVARESKDALSRAKKMDRKLSEWKHQLEETSSKTSLLLLNLLAGNPYLTINRVAKKLDVAFTTAQRALKNLEELSIIAEVSHAKRDRVYCAKPLLALLEGSSLKATDA